MRLARWRRCRRRTGHRLAVAGGAGDGARRSAGSNGRRQRIDGGGRQHGRRSAPSVVVSGGGGRSGGRRGWSWSGSVVAVAVVGAAARWCAAPRCSWGRARSPAAPPAVAGACGGGSRRLVGRRRPTTARGTPTISTNGRGPHPAAEQVARPAVRVVALVGYQGQLHRCPHRPLRLAPRRRGGGGMRRLPRPPASASAGVTIPARRSAATDQHAQPTADLELLAGQRARHHAQVDGVQLRCSPRPSAGARRAAAPRSSGPPSRVSHTSCSTSLTWLRSARASAPGCRRRRAPSPWTGSST